MTDSRDAADPATSDDEPLRSIEVYSFRQEAGLFATTGRTIHLWRAWFWARQLEPGTVPPWMLEYLDRVAERMHRTAPRTNKEVADLFELGAANRHVQYDNDRDQLAGQVQVWLDEHPAAKARRIERAIEAVAKDAGVSEAAVRHAYYFFQEIRQKTRK